LLSRIWTFERILSNIQPETPIEQQAHFTLLDTSRNSNPGTQPPTNPPTPTNKASAQLEPAHIKPVDNETPEKTPEETP